MTGNLHNIIGNCITGIKCSFDNIIIAKLQGPGDTYCNIVSFECLGNIIKIKINVRNVANKKCSRLSAQQLQVCDDYNACPKIHTSIQVLLL